MDRPSTYWPQKELIALESFESESLAGSKSLMPCLELEECGERNAVHNTIIIRSNFYFPLLFLSKPNNGREIFIFSFPFSSKQSSKQTISLKFGPLGESLRQFSGPFTSFLVITYVPLLMNAMWQKKLFTIFHNMQNLSMRVGSGGGSSGFIHDLP